jgi:hypothetical protein
VENIYVGKSRAVGKRDVVPFRSDEALLTVLTSQRVVDFSAKSPNLSGRVDGMAFSIHVLKDHTRQYGK